MTTASQLSLGVAFLLGCATSTSSPSARSVAPLPSDADVREEIITVSTSETEAPGVYFDWTCPDERGEISLKLRLVLETPSTVYRWRGRADPALGHILFVEVIRDGVALNVARFLGPLPEFPYPGDSVTGTEVRYEHPLRILVSDNNEPPQRGGNYTVNVRYDTSEAVDSSYERAGLSRLRLLSAPNLRACD